MTHIKRTLTYTVDVEVTTPFEYSTEKLAELVHLQVEADTFNPVVRVESVQTVSCRSHGKIVRFRRR